MIALRLQSSDTTTASALSAAVSRQGWCEALSAALGSGYRVVWRDAGDVARVTLTMAGTLPISEQRVQISAQPAAVSCSSGTPTKTLLESADGTRWALLERMVPLVDGAGSPLAPVTGAGFRWVDPLVVQPPVQLAGTPAWLASLDLMTWAQISNTSMGTVMLDPVGRALDRALGWCGGTLKEDGSEIFVATGGHADGASNSIYSLRLSDDAPAWVRRNEPTMTGLTQDVSHYTDGRPSARHTYWNIQFCQGRNLLMLFGAAAVWGSGGTNEENVDAFDPAANDYVAANTFPAVPVSMNVDRPIVMVGDDCYHQSNAGSATISKWSSGSGTYGSWSTVGTAVAFEAGPALVHDPVRERLARIDATRPAYINLSTGAVTTGANYSGATAAKVREKCSAVYIPAIGSPLDDRYVVTEFGARLLGASLDLHVVDPDTSAVTVASVSGTKPTLRTDGTGHTYGRMMYVPELRCIVLVAREDRDVYALRLA